MQEKKYVATLMKKTNLGKGCFIYSPAGTKALIGKIDEANKVLYVDDNIHYLSMEDPYLMLSEEEYAYANAVTTRDLRKVYPTSAFSYEEMISTYNDDCSYVAFLNKVNELTGEVVSVPVDLEKVAIDDEEKNVSYGYTDYGDFANEEGTVEMYRSVDGENYKVNNVYINIDEILNGGSIDGYTSEELEFISNALTVVIDQFTTAQTKVDSKVKKVKSKAKDTYTFNKKGKLPVDAKTKDELYQKVKATIKGQDKALKNIVTSILKLELYNKERKGILITGDSGCGKTEIMKLLSENLDRPFMKVNSKQLTSAGYVGDDIEEILYALYKKCDCDVAKTEHAILYFDEIDKLGSSSKENVNGQGVLNSLLAVLDGSIYKAKESTKSGFGAKGEVSIDTSNMIIIAGGAFSDVYHSKYDQKKALGFNCENEEVKEKEPTTADFVEKALMTEEFMGRFPIRIHLNPMNKDVLRQILLSSSKSPLLIDKERFDLLGVELETTEEFNELLIDKALKTNTGARGLSIYEKISNPAFDYALSNHESINKIILTEDTIIDNDKFELEQKAKELVKK